MPSYKTTGVCSSNIDFDITDGKLQKVRFTRGCNGNTQGVARLVEGMTPEEVINKLKGIKCAGKSTSCPDQLAKALEQHLQR